MRDWVNLIGPLLLIIAVIILLVLVALRMRRNFAKGLKVNEYDLKVRQTEPSELETFLLDKIAGDLSGEETSPAIRSYLTAFRKVVEEHGVYRNNLQNVDGAFCKNCTGNTYGTYKVGNQFPCKTMKAVAEVYRYRKGFKNEWIGE